METKFTGRQEVYRCVDVIVTTPMIDKIDFKLAPFCTPVPSEASCNDAFRRTAEVSELQAKYDPLAAKLGSVTTECGTGRLFACKSGDDFINLRASFNTLRTSINYSRVRSRLCKKKKSLSLLTMTHMLQKLVIFNGVESLLHCV